MVSLFKRLWLSHLRSRWQQPAKASSPFTLAVEELESRVVLSANYYISPSGNDNLNGMSPQTAWRSINRVAQQGYGPGDTINFQGGVAYNGNLNLYSAHGTADNPVTLTSYNGTATLNAGAGNGIWLWDATGVHITNLNLVGTTNTQTASIGINIYSSTTGSRDIYVDNMDISGFGMGIQVFADTNRVIDDVQISHVSIHDLWAPDNGGDGIVVYGSAPSQRSISDVYIGDVQVSNSQIRFGIYLENVTNGLVERSIVHDTAGPQSASTIGITAWNSDGITFQYNEVYDIFDPYKLDGDGLFFGNGVDGSLMQYNYVHDNDGFGLALVADVSGEVANVGNTIRFNIAQNDGSAEIIVASNVWYADVYNNTVYTSSTTATGLDVFLLNWSGQGLHFRNNIFQGTAGSLNLWANFSSLVTGRDLVFQNNAYYIEGGNIEIGYTNRLFTNLSDWQNATSEELLDDGTPVGYEGDPQLVAPGQGGTIGNPDLLPTLTAYNLQSTSPLNFAGLDLAGLFGLNPGGQDFYGTPLGLGQGFSIGAYQSLGLDISRVEVRAVPSKHAADLIALSDAQNPTSQQDLFAAGSQPGRTHGKLGSGDSAPAGTTAGAVSAALLVLKHDGHGTVDLSGVDPAERIDPFFALAALDA